VLDFVPLASGTDNENDIHLPPSAADLLESMRAIGYTFEAALADLIDNSLSADAHRIELHFTPYDRPYVAVLDDGLGMSSIELTGAMRHGSRDPRLLRAPHDLGRFGLGLKTASLSQCRRLTVVSLKDGEVSARQWDLDHIARRRDWMLIQFSDVQIKALPLVDELRAQGHGTLVLWENFDRLVADGTPLERALGSSFDLARAHLSLVFHRFINPPPGTPPIQISINRNPLRAIDPFLSSHKATQVLPVETFIIEQERIEVKPFLLPHISKLSAADLELAGGEDGLRRNQGFYVYRNRRLISWGSWFRLVRQEELTKLARVQVDTSNRLDHLWQLDIKKSKAYPPQSLRDGLKQIIARIAEGSRRVFTFRGRKTPDPIVRAWDRTVDRGGVEYRINREHPLVEALEKSFPDDISPLLEELMKVLEETLPFDAVYADMAAERRPNLAVSNDDEHDALQVLADTILSSLGPESAEGKRFLAALTKTEPFSRAPRIAQAIVERFAS
jgi:hypothetical protein